jgi:predicted secreted protein
MKLLFIVLILSYLSSTISNDTNDISKQKVYDIAQNENKLIELGVNEEFTVSLPGNPSTGYTWHYSKEENSILKLKSSSFEQNKAPKGLVGVPGIFYFTFESKNKGKEEIKFIYMRSWENSNSNKINNAIVVVK